MTNNRLAQRAHFPSTIARGEWSFRFHPAEAEADRLILID